MYSNFSSQLFPSLRTCLRSRYAVIFLSAPVTTDLSGQCDNSTPITSSGVTSCHLQLRYLPSAQKETSEVSETF